MGAHTVIAKPVKMSVLDDLWTNVAYYLNQK